MSLKSTLRRWLEVPPAFPSSIWGNVRIEAKVPTDSRLAPVAIHVRGPSRNAMATCEGTVHAIDFERDGSVNIYVIANRIDLEQTGVKP